jgi:hypothetical protein
VQAWEQLCLIRADQAVGREGLSFLHGPLTDAATVAKLTAAIEEGKRVRVKLVNYKGGWGGGAGGGGGAALETRQSITRALSSPAPARVPPGAKKPAKAPLPPPRGARPGPVPPAAGEAVAHAALGAPLTPDPRPLS